MVALVARIAATFVILAAFVVADDEVGVVAFRFDFGRDIPKLCAGGSRHFF
jgi:hypothetical protein